MRFPNFYKSYFYSYYGNDFGDLPTLHPNSFLPKDRARGTLLGPGPGVKNPKIHPNHCKSDVIMAPSVINEARSAAVIAYISLLYLGIPR